MKNNFKLLFALLLAVFMGIVSCQRDDSYLSKNFTAGNSRIINLEQLKAMPDAFRKLEKVINRQQRKTANDSLWKFEINTDEILHYKSSTGESYTFSVYPEKQRDYLENLVLNREADGSYSVYYMVYNLTANEIKQVQSGIFTDVSSKTFICSITGVDTAGLLKSGGQGEIIYYQGKCYRWQAYRSTVLQDQHGQNEFSEWGMELVEVDCPTSSTPGGDIPGDNRGGGTIGIPVFNTPPGYTIPAPVMPPLGVAGYNGPKKPVITRPVSFIGNKKECEKIAGIMDTGGYRAKIAAMAGLVDDTVNEHGFGMYQTGVPHDFISGPEMAIPTPFFFNKYMAFHHTHNAAPDGGTYSIFSDSDINAIMQLMVNNSIDPANFTATLSTKKGTHYAITISDVSKFKAFYFHKFNVFASLSQPDKLKYSEAVKKQEKLIRKYFDPENGAIKKQNVNNEVTLGHFLNFIKEADLGISVFEADANFETFTQVAKGSSSLTDFTIVRKQCAK